VSTENSKAKVILDRYAVFRNATAVFRIIIDSGFWRRADRDAMRRLTASQGADIKLYALECPEDEMLERVLARNERLAEEGSLFIDRNAFELFKTESSP
jgi:hypothetical protein